MSQPYRFMSALLLLAAACAGPRGASSADRAKYPPRPPSCALRLFHSAAPLVTAWDDLGVAEVACHLDVGFRECLRRFQAEACRLGGDIVYALPEKAERPREHAILYRGRVAHTRAGDGGGAGGATSPTPPAAPPDASNAGGAGPPPPGTDR